MDTHQDSLHLELLAQCFASRGHTQIGHNQDHNSVVAHWEDNQVHSGIQIVLAPAAHSLDFLEKLRMADRNYWEQVDCTDWVPVKVGNCLVMVDKDLLEHLLEVAAMLNYN